VGSYDPGGSRGVGGWGKAVAGTSTLDVMLVMITQYFDTIKSIGEMDKTNTLFLSHSPGAVRDISEQIMQSMLVADRAKS
jgi:hypothetical protein